MLLSGSSDGYSPLPCQWADHYRWMGFPFRSHSGRTNGLAITGSAAAAATPTPSASPSPTPATRLVSTGGTDSGDCTVSPCGTIAYAISQAAPGETVSIAAGTYTQPGITVNKDLAFTGAGAATTIVQADFTPHTAGNRIFDITSGSSVVSMSGMTIMNGNISDVGGAIRNLGDLTITDSVITANRAISASGGGIASYGPLTITNSTLSENESGELGGGIVAYDTSVTINNSSLSSNTVTAALVPGGGGMYCSNCIVTIAGSTVNGNTATGFAAVGGGIWVDNPGINAGTITNSTISGNTVSGNGSFGGGIAADSWPSTLTGVTITDNRSLSSNSSGTAAGFYDNTSQALLRNCIVADNFTDLAGTLEANVVGTLAPASSFNLIGTGGAGGLTDGVNNNQVDVADPGLGALADNGGPTLTHALMFGSSAIDKGSAFGLTTDQRGAGFARAFDDTFIANADDGTDIGAFELESAAPTPTPAQNIIINEVDSDQTGTDTAEFVELYDGGVGNVSLDGLVLVFYNGSNNLSYNAVDLDGLMTNASGYYVLNLPSNGLQNGDDAIAIYEANGSNFPNGTAVTTTNLRDALVYDTDDLDNATLLTLLNAGQPQINENEHGQTETQSMQRCPNGSGGERNTSTYDTHLPTPGVLNVCPAYPIVTFDAAPTPTYLGGDFTVNATTTNTDDPTLIYSKVSGPCDFVSGATFSSTGAGTCVVMADGAATTNFEAGSATQNVSIDLATAVITFTPPRHQRIRAPILWLML